LPPLELAQSSPGLALQKGQTSVIGLTGSRSGILVFITPRTVSHVLRAIRVSARLNDKGEWVEPPSHVVVSSGGRIATPQFGSFPQISMTQVVLPPPIAPYANAQTQTPAPAAPQFELSPVEIPQPQTSTLESAATPQLGAASHNHEEIPAPSATILSAEPPTT
jgi:hypothetical protein